MKHEDLYRRALNRLPRRSMTAQEKELFDAEQVMKHGERIDSEIEKGLSAGLTEDAMEKILGDMLVSAVSAIFGIRE